MLRLVQVKHSVLGRRVGVINGKTCRLLDRFRSAYVLVQWALASGENLDAVVNGHLGDEVLDYDAIYNGQSDWCLLPAFDHPDEPARCLVSGTGLTHMASAKNRNAMHEKAASMPMTDSMKMFQWGLDGGNPKPGQIGAQPEWFYKGSGTILKAHGEAMDVPSFADDGGEEPELAGVHVNDENGQPCRVGFVVGNEFADHVMEKKNYLYLAPSKLRDAAIGPELIVGG
ncbi:MAG: GguC protein, partial [Candidatus Latescibacteria bacterium]|nr:GguC protein [Candidatus Latescibacterota bacterium]